GRAGPARLTDRRRRRHLPTARENGRGQSAQGDARALGHPPGRGRRRRVGDGRQTGLTRSPGCFICEAAKEACLLRRKPKRRPMPELGALAGFAVVTAVLVATPGPGVLYIVGRSRRRQVDKLGGLAP